MLYAAGLVFTIALCGWLSVSSLFVERWRHGSLASGLFALAALLWAAGELMLQAASSPAELAVARRVLFLGASFTGPLWFWLAAQTAHPQRWLRWRWLLLASLPIPLFVYSTLWWAEGVWFVDLTASTPRHGPLFPVMILYHFPLLGLGIVYFLQALRRIEASRLRRGAALAGTVVPFAGNVLYQIGVFGNVDPTPVLIGVGGVVLCLGLVHSGLNLELPIARSKVIEMLDVGILVADASDRVVDANPAARRLLGGAPLLGRSRRELTEGRDDGRSQIDIQQFELRGARGPVGSAVLLTDQTEAMAARRRLELAGRLEALGHLVAGIAHEVNNPVAFIRANLCQLESIAWEWAETPPGAAVVQDLRERSEGACEIVAETQQGVNRIADLVLRLRAFAGHQHEGREQFPISLADVALRARDMARIGVGAEAIEVRAEDVPKVLGSEGELVQIVLNLLVNAIQASADGAAPRAEIEVAPEGEGVVLRVLDRGAGIAAEDLGQIFDPFFTTKPPGVGTGLGLSISFDLARQHGGRLEAGNRPGGGAVFTLWLPTAAS